MLTQFNISVKMGKCFWGVGEKWGGLPMIFL